MKVLLIVCMVASTSWAQIWKDYQWGSDEVEDLQIPYKSSQSEIDDLTSKDAYKEESPSIDQLLHKDAEFIDSNQLAAQQKLLTPDNTLAESSEDYDYSEDDNLQAEIEEDQYGNQWKEQQEEASKATAETDQNQYIQTHEEEQDQFNDDSDYIQKSESNDEGDMKETIDEEQYTPEEDHSVDDETDNVQKSYSNTEGESFDDLDKNGLVQSEEVPPTPELTNIDESQSKTQEQDESVDVDLSKPTVLVESSDNLGVDESNDYDNSVNPSQADAQEQNQLTLNSEEMQTQSFVNGFNSDANQKQEFQTNDFQSDSLENGKSSDDQRKYEIYDDPIKPQVSLDDYQRQQRFVVNRRTYNNEPKKHSRILRLVPSNSNNYPSRQKRGVVYRPLFQYKQEEARKQRMHVNNQPHRHVQTQPPVPSNSNNYPSRQKRGVVYRPLFQYKQEEARKQRIKADKQAKKYSGKHVVAHQYYRPQTVQRYHRDVSYRPLVQNKQKESGKSRSQTERNYRVNPAQQHPQKYYPE